MRAAVVGLGRMGQAIAGRLLAGGSPLTVWNRSPGRGHDLLARGAQRADSVEDAVRGADIVLCSLSGDGAVHDVLLPDGRPIPDLTGTLVDCSTVAPATSCELAVGYPDRFVACPVAGGPPSVESGEAILIVAGPAPAVRSADDTLSMLSDTRMYVGTEVRTAAAVKLMNNFLLMAGLAALADAVAVARSSGLSDTELPDLLRSLAVVAPGLHNRIEGLVSGDHAGWFSVELGAKDLGLFDDLAKQAAIAPRLANAVRWCYEDTCELGLGDRDLTAIIELVCRAGVAG